jgi:D-alanyl-D-alanine carboxypeptidase/D-alanyl-D-alanine-endopeptidase (penicillin-binding protein 4)
VWLAVAGGLVVLAVAAAAFLRPSPAAPDQPPAAVPTLPPPPPVVLPAAAGDAPAPTADGVAAAVADLLAGSGAGTLGAAVVDAATGDRLYGRGADRPAVPASTTKLVTAATVLATRGPAYQIPTVAVAGSRSGEVVLVGGGDPTLAVDEGGSYPGAGRLDLLAAQVLDAFGPAPVTRVTVDATLFTGEVYGRWDADIPHGGHVGPITALMTDGGRTDPEQEAPAARFEAPDLAAGEAFAELLGADRVERGEAPPPPAAGSATPAGTVPPGTRLGEVSSPPMVRLVDIMLSTSDNVVAEALARQVALARGEPASFQGAAGAMVGVLADLGVPAGDSTLADGSGQSRDNRLSATLLTHLLLTALERPELAGTVAGLPVAGWSGTLAERYRTPEPATGPGAGVVRAKTGTLAGVAALAGLVVTADGRLLAFALLANDAPRDAYQALDRAAAALAGCGCSG